MPNLNQLKIMIATLIAAISLGTALMIAVYCLPTDRMFDHIKGSVDFMKMGEVPRWSKSVIHTSLDNFADSTILLKAAYPVKNPVEDAMLVPSWNPIWQGVYYPAKGFVQIVENGHLDVENGENTYPRYWHGYMVVVKPLLLFFTSEQLRVLNLYVQFLLTFVALMLIYKCLGIYYTYAFALIVMIINPITTVLAFQHTNVYVTMLLTIISILLFNDKLKQGSRYPCFFMLIGIVTAFFDLLTYPLVPLGMGLVIYFAVNKNSFVEHSEKSAIVRLMNNSFSWLFGYAGMWSGKIFATILLTDYDIFHDAINALIMRTSHHNGSIAVGEPITVLQTIIINVRSFCAGPIKIFLLLTFIYICYLIFKHSKKFVFNKVTFISLIFIAAMPFVWYAVLCNHSFAHTHFAYRELTITAFSVLALIIESVNNAELRIKNWE